MMFAQINLIYAMADEKVDSRDFDGKSLSAGGDGQYLVDGVWHQHVRIGEGQRKGV